MGSRFTQDDLSQVRLIYRQFEDLLSFLLAAEEEGPAADRALMSTHKAAHYFDLYVRKATHLLNFVAHRNRHDDA